MVQSNPVEASAATRIMSIDALRGFVMFWLIGGHAILMAFATWVNWPWFRDYIQREFEHPPWHGFHWWDVVMPTFLFVSGLTIPLSITRRLAQGEAKRRLYGRILRRLVLLMALSTILNGALKHLDIHQMRFMGVLARIGMTYAIAALITMHTTPRQQVLWLIGILIGYWAAMMLIPIPGIGRGLLTPEGNLAAFMDRNLLPGQIRGGLYDRLGLYSTLPAVSTVLIGVLAGHWLLNLQSSPMRKVAGLLGAFGGCWAAGLAVAQYIPINTKFWSPSYVLSAGAWSLFILAVFYLIIDVWRFRKLAFFFVVIGMNSITIYCLQSPVDFKDIADFFFAGVLALASPAVQTVLLATATLLVKWCLLLFLYRHRIFLRA